MNIANGIGNTHQPLSLISTSSTNGAAQTEQIKQTANASTPVAKDAAKLTSTAGLVLQAMSAPDTRSSQVEAIQKSIAAGTYNVSASAVADKMIESMLG